MRELDPLFRCFRKKVVGIEHIFSIGKIQKEWMLFARDNKTSSYWKLSNRWNQWIQLIWTSSVKVAIDEDQTDRQWTKWEKCSSLISLCNLSYILSKVDNICWEELAQIWEQYSIQGKIWFLFWVKQNIGRCLWYKGYWHKKLIQPLEFKSWMRLVAIYIALIHMRKVWIQLYSLQLWVNSRAE